MPELNFFNSYIANERLLKKRTLIAAGICALLCLLIGGFYAGTEIYSAYLNKNIKSMNAYINSKENVEKLKKINSMKKKIEIMNKYDLAVDEINASLNTSNKIKSTVIEALNTAIPDNISFTSLTLTQDTFQIQGSAPGWTRVAELKHNLDALGIFQKVWVGTIQSSDNTQDSCTFSAQCTLKDVIEK